VVELVDAVLTTKKDIMRGKLLTDIEIIKFDGTNKKMIVDRLSIKEHSNLYFQAKDVYFIIPVHDVDEWFILDEFQFKKKILIK
jgi:hypothetical protein